MMNISPTRRGFLGGAIAGMAAAVPPARGAADSAPFHLGIATYSLREFQRGLAIRTITQLGVSHVSIKEFHLPYILPLEEVRSGAREFEKAGITIAGGGVISIEEDDDADVRKYFEYARAAHMPMMTIMPTRQTLPRIERFVKEYDIKVALHNHGPEDHNFPTPESALEAIRGMDPRVGLCIDLGHTARTGTDPVESVRRAGSRLIDMHIKDMKNLRDGDSQVPVGDGSMPIVALFQELRRMNYQGCVNLEYEIEGDSPMLGMAKSFSYMRGVLAGLNG